MGGFVSEERKRERRLPCVRPAGDRWLTFLLPIPIGADCRAGRSVAGPAGC